MKKKKAFTLAEVLITLGIIGVVAAMTLPSLIIKYRHKELQVGLQKAYSNVSQAYLLTKSQLGVDNIHKTYTYYDASKGGYIYSNDFINAFYKNLKVVKTITAQSYLNFNNTNKTTPSSCGTSCPHITKILPDGSGIGAFVNSATIYLYVDTNGPYKGPNRMGFDAFSFYVTTKDKIMPIKSGDQYGTCDEDGEGSDACTMSYPCSATLKQAANGMGCAWFAINDISPVDEKYSYWDNLPK